MPEVSDILFYLAAGISLLGVIAHEVVGSPKVLGPLKTSDLPDEVIWLHHFSWRVASIAVLAMMSLFLLAAWQPSGFIFAAIATAMSAGLTALGVSLAIFGNKALWRTPAPYPWAIIAIVGGLGLFLMNPLV